MRTALALALLLTTTAAAGAEPVPPEAAPAASAKKPIGAVMAGAAYLTFGVSYGGSLVTGLLYTVLVVPFIAAAKSRIPTDPFLLFVPVGGPLQIIHNDHLDHGTQSLLYADAIAQGAGIALGITGLLLITTSDSSKSALHPVVFPGGAGLSARF